MIARRFSRRTAVSKRACRGCWSMLAEEGVSGTFFITGDVARRYPSEVESWARAGHEIGCHGDTHRPFDTLDEQTARNEIQASTATLRKFAPCRSFRAPNLRFPESLCAAAGAGRLHAGFVAGQIQAARTG